jgi:hypothetical protein
MRGEKTSFLRAHRLCTPLFNWRPRGAQGLNLDGLLKPETLVDDIPMRSSVRDALKKYSIFRIEDLSAVSEQELLNESAIGVKSVGRLREILKQVGLDFLPNPKPEERARELNKAVLRLPPDLRVLALRGLEDSASVSALGLKSSTLSRALAQRYETLGQLRRLSLPALCSGFSKREVREIYDLLMATDRPFAGSAPAIELWRQGLVSKEEIPVPTAAETPIAELRPWLGTAVDSLSSFGIHTLGALQRKVPIGKETSFGDLRRTTIERVQAFLV